MALLNGDSNARAGPSRRRTIISDSEDEDTPRRASKRRKTPSPPLSTQDHGRSDVDDDAESNIGNTQIPQTVPRGNGYTNGHGHAEEFDDEEESDAVHVKPERMDEDGIDGEDVPDVTEEDRGRVIFRPEYKRDKDGYVAGSLVRIKCKNFMTYDAVEFRPGPHLNMILGPNGTGKSTIAAAIAIGLGFPAKVMGRANDIKAYVKQGTEQAMTEIEVKAAPKKKNIVIKRVFTRDNDTSEWYLNGAPARKREVADIVEDMGIQANNLCSFLPQDKVAEFAKMNPVTVLRETMRAAGDPRMTQWHEALCKKGDQAQTVENRVSELKGARDNLQILVDRDEPEVVRFEARAEKEAERDMLQTKVLVLETMDSATVLKKVKVARRQLARQQQDETALRRPLMNLHQKQKDIRTDYERDVQKAEETMRKANDEAKRANRAYDAVSGRCAEVDGKLKRVKDKIAKAEAEKAKQREHIRKCTELLNRPRGELDAEYKTKTRQAREIKDKQTLEDRTVDELSQQNRENDLELREAQQKIDALSKQLSSLESLEMQREQDARNMDPSIEFMLDWIEKNPMKLEGKVHKPPMISVNVRDLRLAAQIESCTSMTQRMTFICESKADYNTLADLNGEVRCNVMYQQITEGGVNPPRPCDPQTLARLGLEGFAIDFVDAEPAVIAFLNEKCRMHQAAVTSRDGRQIDGAAVAAAGIPTYNTKTDNNRIMRAAYGKRNTLTTSTAAVPAKAFNKTVDTARIKQVADDKAALTTKMRESEAPQRELRAKLDQAKERAQRLRAEFAELESDCQRIRSQLQQMTRAQFDLDRAKSELERLENGPSSEAMRAELREEKLGIVMDVMGPVKQHQNATQKSLDALDDLITGSLGIVQNTANVAAIDVKLKDKDGRVSKFKEDLADLDREIDKRRHELEEGTKRVRAALINHSADQALRIQAEAKAPGADVQQVREQLGDVVAELALSEQTDEGTLRRFKQNQLRLEETLDELGDAEKDLAVVRRQIDKIRGNFDPALDSLIGVVSDRFSASFEKVGCAGEVEADRVEGDFKNWGIRILVSFRAGERLQPLTASIQSGGERALATVTYLMSLSEMARTPFSLVDEINQGMDKKYERSMHNQLVGVTCADDAGQYFLITPKLLVGLDYHPKMKVLIVNNGIHLPDTMSKASDLKPRFGDLGSCLKRYQQHVAAH